MGHAPVHQLLMTRFNIRSSTVGYTDQQPADWLERRFALFSRFCAPSVAAQTEEDFDWLVFCDENTSARDVDRIRRFDSRIRVVRVAPKAPRPPELSVHHYVRPGAEIVVSTRLDNDDALSRHALRRVRDQIARFLEAGTRNWLYNPMLGYKLQLETGQLFEATHRSNPFLSLFERVSGYYPPSGAFSESHGYMHTLYPTHQDTEARMWLQIIHGGNVSNSIRAGDVEVPLSDIGDDFPLDLGGTDAVQPNRIMRPCRPSG